MTVAEKKFKEILRLWRADRLSEEDDDHVFEVWFFTMFPYLDYETVRNVAHSLFALMPELKEC